MALEFREGTINFPPTTGRRERRQTSVNFARPVRSAQVVLKGFNISYNNGDHHILELEIDLDSSISGSMVNIFGDFVFRDSSGYFDDPYSGWINFVVMADLT
jgi:hypothetical protein